MVAAGQLLAGKYRVDRVLGEGGMGLLVAATDLSRQERVALKLIRPEALRVPELVERFRREAATASRLTSAHVVRVRDVGAFEGGAPYLVMELLDGEDLAAVLLRCGRLSVSDAVDVVLQACHALAEAHALGIVHRDVSPANLFVARTPAGPVVKVLDFGVATAGPLDKPVSPMTRTGTVLGCPLYASPEQLQSSKHVDARSDIWSLGAVLYELLAGRPPYVADSLGGLLGQMLLTEPEPVRASRHDVPEAVDAAILRCLTRDRNARFASVQELASVLAPFGTPPAHSSRPSRAAPPARTGTVVVGIVLAVLLIAALSAGWAMKRTGWRPGAHYQRTSAQPQ